MSSGTGVVAGEQKRSFSTVLASKKVPRHVVDFGPHDLPRMCDDLLAVVIASKLWIMETKAAWEREVRERKEGPAWAQGRWEVEGLGGKIADMDSAQLVAVKTIERARNAYRWFERACKEGGEEDGTRKEAEEQCIIVGKKIWENHLQLQESGQNLLELGLVKRA